MRVSKKKLLGSVALLAAVITSASAAAAPSSSSFVAFESGHVRPLAVSADKSLVFAVNTPDNRLEILRAESDRLVHLHSVPVGLEPVAVAVRDKNEIWVVNHLSDSVSIVRLDHNNPRVVQTLQVGDEPRDIVFAGKNKSRAFITTAHRGQNAPFDPQLKTPGVGRADVWVFDAKDPGEGLGGKPLTILSLFGDTPRALATSKDGSDTMDPVKSMLDGKTYDSKSALRATYKAGGVEEVGNDPSIHRMKPVPRSDPKKIEESVHKAFARVGL